MKDQASLSEEEVSDVGTYLFRLHSCHAQLYNLHALVTAKLLAVSMLSTCGTKLKGASVALGLVL